MLYDEKLWRDLQHQSVTEKSSSNSRNPASIIEISEKGVKLMKKFNSKILCTIKPSADLPNLMRLSLLNMFSINKRYTNRKHCSSGEERRGGAERFLLTRTLVHLKSRTVQNYTHVR
jgi:hypothetical protein